MIGADGKKISLPRDSKDKVAKNILNTVLQIPLNEDLFHFTKFNPISLVRIVSENALKKIKAYKK